MPYGQVTAELRSIWHIRAVLAQYESSRLVLGFRVTVAEVSGGFLRR